MELLFHYLPCDLQLISYYLYKICKNDVRLLQFVVQRCSLFGSLLCQVITLSIVIKTTVNNE